MHVIALHVMPLHAIALHAIALHCMSVPCICLSQATNLIQSLHIALETLLAARLFAQHVSKVKGRYGNIEKFLNFVYFAYIQMHKY